ncbi:MAG: ChbG/HpnK family deacetylase [Dysgonamonadaceae bacterium]|jgi:predicted glycoside hydrolase/deacetylase ChbG (UPF0249 family)|nr:ChbG/HpnK family deacetylase [Dysgonamonadaceae bacterium]
MKIILHADDFGFDKDTCQATIELFEKGILKSATIMVNMPASCIAIEYARQHPEFSFGVHLTYVDGLQPVSHPQEISSLTDNDGLFLPSNVVRKKALMGKIHKKDIVIESLGQINVLKEAGISVSHLDSHGHLHKFPVFLFAMKEICIQSGIHKIRRVQNVHLTKQPIFQPTTILNTLFDKYISSHFQTTDKFYMPANDMDSCWSDSLLKIISCFAPQSVLEIGVHPGYMEEWRKDEYRDICEFANSIKEIKQYESINWKEIY